ncbi:MAG: phosphoribosyl-ATP pyrophosphohydrolase [Caldicoprobacterales bacterium]|jgi:predicted house-cleaning noncanonical NTP pyrophosphatase (MazG superfamily)|nr:nucleoside triphosphate pyrophosphohydrolase [Clostridiales bacterium]
MKVIEHNKLVRDKIPKIIEESGKQAVVYKEQGDKLLTYLNNKLQEELNEYKRNGDIEELVDLVEVIYAIIHHKGVSLTEFEKLREEKISKRGAFREGFVLVKVVE